MGRSVRGAAAAAIALGWGAAFLGPARAAGAYDGTWVIDIPQATTDIGRTTPTCPALRLNAKIVDSKVNATLERVASGTINTVENGTGPAASPLTGNVEADGMLIAEWQGYHASGQLNGDSGRVVVQGQCGPRTATVTRVAK